MSGIGSNAVQFHVSTPMAETVPLRGGSLGIKDRRKRGELRIGGWGREKGWYDIMPYPSSPLYLESLSRRDMEWRQRSWA
jgi:hypothetical protein